MTTVSKVIRELHESRSLSQTQLAQRSNISRSHLWHIERGHMLPGPSCLPPYCREGKKYKIEPSTKMTAPITRATRRLCLVCRAVDVWSSCGSRFGVRADCTSIVRLTRRPKSDNASSADFTVPAYRPSTEGTKRVTSSVVRLTIMRPKTNRSRKQVKADSHLPSIATTITTKKSSTKLGFSRGLCKPLQSSKVVTEK